MRPKLSETRKLAGLSPQRHQSLTGGRRSVSVPRAGESDDFIVQPPGSMQVESVGRVVLHDADGRPLGRRIGYQ